MSMDKENFEEVSQKQVNLEIPAEEKMLGNKREAENELETKSKKTIVNSLYLRRSRLFRKKKFKGK